MGKLWHRRVESSMAEPQPNLKSENRSRVREACAANPKQTGKPNGKTLSEKTTCRQIVERMRVMVAAPAAFGVADVCSASCQLAEGLIVMPERHWETCDYKA
jgi:hypothetical protein